jgi:uncharacterized protein YbaA (DUF1428 family)
MSYVDMFVCAVPTANRTLYLEHVTATTALLKAHGALKVMECWGDDIPEGKVTSPRWSGHRGKRVTKA